MNLFRNSRLRSGEPSSSADQGSGPDQGERRFRQALGATFILLILALLTGGFFYLSRRQAQARHTAHDELQAIADLKLQQITQWREERLSDARFFSQAAFVSQDVQRFLQNPNSESARAQVLHWITLLKGGNRYQAVVLYDSNLQLRLAVPASSAEPDINLRQRLDKALQTGDVVMSDLHRNTPTSEVEIDLLLPIFRDPQNRTAPPLAAILLKANARQFLFPVVQSWPLATRSGETLLARQEGQDVLFLTDLRHRPDSALKLRLPLQSPSLPAARALRGETGAMEGLDYRGVPVVAVGRKVPGTTWVMIAKIDQDEIYAPLRRETFTVLAVLGALLLASTLLVLLLWRHRAGEALRRELLLHKEQLALSERIAHLMRNANDAILLADAHGQIMEANHRAEQQYGFSQAELIGQRLIDLRPPETKPEFHAAFERVKSGAQTIFESIHKRKDGSTFPVEVSARLITIGGTPCVLSIIRDITERKAHEREIERMNRLYAAFGHVNQAIIHAQSKEQLFQDTSRVLVQYGGFEMAWIGWVDKQSKQVLPISQFGDNAGYLKEVRIFSDDRPEGRGPVGTSIRTKHPCICNDIANDARMQPWRQSAARSGWRSLASFPISQQPDVCGALAVYSQTLNFFGPNEKALLEEAAAEISFALDTLLNEQRRQEAENNLRLFNAALEQRIAQRTAELQAKNQSLETFAYSVSHDLKAPLRSISGFARVTAEEFADKLGPDGQAYLARINDGAAKLNQLIDDLLSYSRLELESVTWSVVDVGQLLQEVIKESQAETLFPNTQIKTDISCDRIVTDRSGLLQSLRNLLGNALKFSAKSALPQVEIKCHRSDRDYLLEIRDNGIGFDMAYKEKIFEIFQRLHSSGEFPGTGVGLAIVRKAVQRMGGSVWAESQPGQGATFCIKIPARHLDPASATNI